MSLKEHIDEVFLTLVLSFSLFLKCSHIICYNYTHNYMHAGLFVTWAMQNIPISGPISLQLICKSYTIIYLSIKSKQLCVQL